MGDYKIYNHVLKNELKNEEVLNNNFVFKSSLSENFISHKLNILDIQSNFVYHNKNWLYSFTENLFSYSYDLTSYVFWNYFYQDSSRLNYKIMWYNSILNNNHNLFISIILDQLFFIAALSLPFFNDFFHHLINADEFNNFLIIHPEYYFIYKNYTNNFYQNYMSNIYLSMYLLTINESFISPIMMITQFFFIFFLVLLFIITYFSYFNNFNNEDNIVDHDYLSFNVTIEAEEEIGSMDDMLLTSVILLYIFLWFFWINSWSYLSITPQLIMSIYLFPFIYFIILFMPISLLYDYGSYFLTYLNGVGKSSVLMLELLFDYIAVSIFFLRLMVQNVRLVFMLFTYGELHELVVFFNIDRNLILMNESFVDGWNNTKTNFNLSNWYLLLKLPVLLLNWLYELFHTFFMVIFQFIAFFAMIFWLFLFLYTMFVLETQENFYTFKRHFRKNYFSKIVNFKNVILQK
jgi:hypothetical protein